MMLSRTVCSSGGYAILVLGKLGLYCWYSAHGKGGG